MGPHDWRTLALAALALGALACHLPASPRTRRAEVDTLRQRLVAAWAAGDAAALADLWTDDAIVMPQGEPAVAGREAILARARAAFELYRARLVLRPEEVMVAGDYAFDRGSYTLTLAPRDGKAPALREEKYLLVLRWQPDGGWRIARGISNASAPAAPAVAPTAAEPSLKGLPPNVEPPSFSPAAPAPSQTPGH